MSTAISGTSFEAALKQNLINDLAAVGANAIGNTWDELTVGNVLAHAGLGCAAASAGGGDCKAGALGAAGAALLNPLIDPWLSCPEDPTARTIEHLIASMLLTGEIAQSLGFDSLGAAVAARNETKARYLLAILPAIPEIMTHGGRASPIDRRNPHRPYSLHTY